MYIVTGIHRGGTTIFGEIIQRITNGCMIYEPFNKQFGIKEISNWYPYLEKKSSVTDRIILQLLNVELDFKKSNVDGDNLFKKIIRRIIFSRGHLDYIKYSLFSRLKKQDVIYKDPFMLLSAPLLASYKKFKVLVVVRHPVSIYNSLMSKQWDFDLNELFSQKNLKNKMQVKENIDLSCTYERIAFLWKQLYRPIMLNASNNNIFLITHEELSVDPYRSVEKITSFMKLPINNRVNRFINENFFNENISANNNSIHDYKRDSKRLAWSWRENYREEYARIEEICNDELRFFYPDIY